MITECWAFLILPVSEGSTISAENIAAGTSKKFDKEYSEFFKDVKRILWEKKKSENFLKSRKRIFGKKLTVALAVSSKCENTTKR